MERGRRRRLLCLWAAAAAAAQGRRDRKRHSNGASFSLLHQGKRGGEGERETRVLMALRHSVAIRGGRRREKFSFFPGFFRGCLGCQGRKEEGGRGEKKSHLLNDAIKPRESAGKEEEEE